MQRIFDHDLVIFWEIKTGSISIHRARLSFLLTWGKSKKSIPIKHHLEILFEQRKSTQTTLEAKKIARSILLPAWGLKNDPPWLIRAETLRPGHLQINYALLDHSSQNMMDGKVRRRQQESRDTTGKTDECSNAAGALGQSQTNRRGLRWHFRWETTLSLSDNDFLNYFCWSIPLTFGHYYTQGDAWCRIIQNK